jgi:hypothetical protein
MAEQIEAELTTLRQLAEQHALAASGRGRGVLAS